MLYLDHAQLKPEIFVNSKIWLAHAYKIGAHGFRPLERAPSF